MSAARSLRDVACLPSHASGVGRQCTEDNRQYAPRLSDPPPQAYAMRTIDEAARGLSTRTTCRFNRASPWSIGSNSRSAQLIPQPSSEVVNFQDTLQDNPHVVHKDMAAVPHPGHVTDSLQERAGR